MSFLSPKKPSTPTPEAIVSTQPIAPLIDTTLPQAPLPLPGAVASTLLADVTNPAIIEETRRRANVLGSAATTLG